MNLREIIKRTPVLRSIARRLMRVRASLGARSFDSASYWEKRYGKGGDSGAGSYDRLAAFKAEILNAFVGEHDISSVIEFGSGDGAQLALGTYPDYIGVDVSQAAIDLTRARFAGDPGKRFLHIAEMGPEVRAELSLSLDVLYHLVEDEVFDRYMKQLFDAATRFAIIYSSNNERPSDAVHVRHRKFTDWVKANRPDFRLVRRIENRYPDNGQGLADTSFADFYIFERVTA